MAHVTGPRGDLQQPLLASYAQEDGISDASREQDQHEQRARAPPPSGRVPPLPPLPSGGGGVLVDPEAPGEQQLKEAARARRQELKGLAFNALSTVGGRTGGRAGGQAAAAQGPVQQNITVLNECSLLCCPLPTAQVFGTGMSLFAKISGKHSKHIAAAAAATLPLFLLLQSAPRTAAAALTPCPRRPPIPPSRRQPGDRCV